MNDQKRRELALQLFEIGAVCFGSYTLKSGIQSPIYLDLRLSISYPRILATIAQVMAEKIQTLSFDLICGVPYTALPFAALISVQNHIPMVLRRKEKKEYGTGRLIEGVFQTNQRCILIEDVITSGASIFETAETLRTSGLIVQDAVVLVDRMQGGVRQLQKQGIRVHSILTIEEFIQVLLRENKVEPSVVKQIQQFIEEHQI